MQISLSNLTTEFNKIPAGFVATNEEHPCYAETADGGMLRIGVVKNEPAGDLTFWREAIKYRLANRFVLMCNEVMRKKEYWRLGWQLVNL